MHELASHEPPNREVIFFSFSWYRNVKCTVGMEPRLWCYYTGYCYICGVTLILGDAAST